MAGLEAGIGVSGFIDVGSYMLLALEGINATYVPKILLQVEVRVGDAVVAIGNGFARLSLIHI